MSIYPSPDKLDKQESKYALVIIAAKRARQIKDNARRLTDSKSPNPLTVALEEIAEGAVIKRVDEDATVTASRAALRPNIPTLEDIIAAGPVLALDSEQDTATQLAAFRSAEPDMDDDDLLGDEGDEIAPVDAYNMGVGNHGMDSDDEEEDLAPDLEEEE